MKRVQNDANFAARRKPTPVPAPGRSSPAPNAPRRTWDAAAQARCARRALAHKEPAQQRRPQPSCAHRPGQRPAQPPTTITSESACSAAASSTARKLSSIFFLRSAVIGAGNMPPRQTLETCKPASFTSAHARCRPASRSCAATARSTGSPWRTQPSTASATLQLSIVI